MRRYLILDDGTSYAGTGFGAPIVSTGELVIQTGMTGYQATITDKVNTGKIIVFTAPLVGTVGINRDDYESIDPALKGVVVAGLADVPGHVASKMTLDEYLTRQRIPAIYGIDTRALMRHVNAAGHPFKASIVDADDEHAYDQLRALVLPHNQVQQVSTEKPYPSPATGRNVVVVDFGLKHSLLRALAVRDCNLTIVPAPTKAESILSLSPDGVVLSDGPGNPGDVAYAEQMIRDIQGKVPLLAIGLGHELFARANGAEIVRLANEHHGINFPVREVATGRVDITTQNHSYGVRSDSIQPDKLLVTHVNVVDGSIEGLRHRLFPAFSVQFQPEGAPGSGDADHVITEFMELMDATDTGY
ncbi:carbamoyl phosphate synthase small subunit [Lacticaseibacillus sharpeae]|uniref:Carbamoyl phosphate synthase small chain n=1 Tax=Lacticaseibacillus sharpeae JCM 1186 = DSM 20505 TaxID=1291052 RepID=A0A0R1ZNI7_9LACO|nr:carbamoyl phosphate synthase small subunit [Lacticaseibacillus sharpeae]KRM56026.1 carbamoyl phosphate synthase small subunit [Lacticaseibacillus sharpeae JCM 1186 = DSM 20505]